MPPKFKRTVSRDDINAADDVEKESLLDNDSDPDEAMLFDRTSASGSNEGRGFRNDKISSVRDEIREVTIVMRDNVEKVLERGERMEDLQLASERLVAVGNEFHDAARRARHRAWMENLRTRIIAGTVVLAIIIIIIGGLIRWNS